MVDRCWYWKRTKILNHLNPWPNVLCFPSCEMVQWLAGHLPCWSFAKGQSPRAPWHCSKLTKLTNICAGTKVELMANQTSLYYYCIYISLPWRGFWERNSFYAHLDLSEKRWSYLAGFWPVLLWTFWNLGNWETGNDPFCWPVCL